MTNGVFSEYELREMAVKFKDATEYVAANCVGSCEEELESKTVTKKCRGVVAKTRTKGTGNGTLKLSAHIPYEIYVQAYGMELDRGGLSAFLWYYSHIAVPFLVVSPGLLLMVRRKENDIEE